MRKLLPLMLAAALAGAGCGGDDETETATTEPSGAATEAPASGGASGDVVTIDMKDIQFQPAEQAVKVGQTVRWVNLDEVQHDADATSGAEFNTDLVGKDGTVEWKADKPGRVQYICSVHPNMKGTLTVE